MAADLSALDLLVVEIDGVHPGDDLVVVAATGLGPRLTDHFQSHNHCTARTSRFAVLSSQLSK